MKKLLFVAATCVALISNVFAGPFTDLGKTLNSLDMSKKESAEGTIPEGQDLFPVIYRHTHDEISKGEKVYKTTMNLKVANVFTDEYKIEYEEYFKYGIGNQCQKVVYTVKKSGGKFVVAIESFLTYAVDKKGNKSADSIAATTSKINAYSKDIVASIEDLFSKTKGDEYKKWEELAYSDLQIQRSVANFASNKLKAKKWYEKHPLEGKTVEVTISIADIRESKKKGYSYELTGLMSGTIDTMVHFFSNNDEYVDLKVGKNLSVKGKVSGIRFSSEYDLEFKVEAFYIDE